MKILQFICHLDVGGAETLVKELSCSLTEQGHQVTVLLLDEFWTTPHAQAARTHLETHGVEVLSLGRKPGAQAPFSAARALVRLLRLRHYDVVHSHLWLPDVLMTLFRPFAGQRPCHVSTIHNSDLKSDGRLWHGTVSRRHNVFCSHAAAAANPALARRSKVIVNGTGFGKITRDEVADRKSIRAEFGIADDDVLLLNIGRIAEQKNQQCLVHAVAELGRTLPRPPHCVIVGRSDAFSPDLVAVAEQLNVAPYLHLPGTRSDIQALLNAADIFVSTSLWEGLPLSVLEAMFSGIACVLSPIAEHREIAAGVPGVLIAPAMGPHDVAETIRTALMEPVSRTATRNQRAALLEPYTIAACARSYMDLYRQPRSPGDDLAPA